jgi:GT2 family glycosyltransferase
LDKSTLGIVVIGRNEGPLLSKCLESVSSSGCDIVYVDSGSSDGSPQLAAEITPLVHELAKGMPFSAARARNEGLDVLLSHNPNITYVQFVDGDCEIHKNWLDEGLEGLRDNEKCAGICGHLREKFPDKNVYHKMCSIEWNDPVGENVDCGGIAMFRVAAFQEVGGFDSSIRAGEEPELCLRLRKAGYFVRKIDKEMGSHDANINNFAQQLARTRMTGYAYTTGFLKHGSFFGGYRHREVMRIIFWAFLIPLSIITLAIFIHWSALLLLALYPLQIVRVSNRTKRVRKLDSATARWHAVITVMGKFAEFQGMLAALRDRKK